MPPKRKKRFHGLYYHSSPPRVLPMNGQAPVESKKKSADDFSIRLSTIRIWMHEKDIGKLTRVLWAGQGNRLRQQASTNPKVKRFLAAVPYVMNTIKDVHQSVVDNNLETLQATMESPVPPALITCKDANGLNVIHKAAGLGHTMILEYLLGIWPDGAHETDMTGKTPLHWAASAKNNMRCYTLLTQAGCEEDVLDYKMKTPAYYKQKHNEIERSFLTLVPEAPRVSQDIPIDWEALASDDGEDKKKPEITIPNGRRRSDALGNNVNLLTSRSEANSIENTSEPDLFQGENANEEQPESPSEAPEAHEEADEPLDNGHLTNGEVKSDPPTPPKTPEEKSNEEEDVSSKDPEKLSDDENVSNDLNDQNNNEANGLNDEEDKKSDNNVEDGDGEAVDSDESPKGSNKDDQNVEESRGENEENCDADIKDQDNNKGNDFQGQNTAEDGGSQENDDETGKHESNNDGEKTDVTDSIKDDNEIDSGNKPEEYVENKEEEVGIENKSEGIPKNEETTQSEKGTVDKETENESEPLLTDDSSSNETQSEKPQSVTSQLEEPQILVKEPSNTSEAIEPEEIESEAKQSQEPSEEENAFAESSPDGTSSENPPQSGKPKSKDSEAGSSHSNGSHTDTPKKQTDEAKNEKKHDSKHDESEEQLKETDDDDDDQDVEIDTIYTPHHHHHPQTDENENNPAFDDKMTSDSPTSSLAIEGFVRGDSEDNQVQSESAAYLDDEEQYIEAIVNSGDMEQLAAIVLNGDGKKILNRTSSKPEIQAFLKNVPAYMDKISRVHEAAKEGTLYQLQAALDRRKFAIAKDETSPCGASPLHVAVLFGHSDIVRYLAGRFPETTSAVDDDGRTALHYAATINDNGHFFNLLAHLGGNPKATDKLGNTAEFYMNDEQAKHVLTYRELLKRFGAEALEDEMLSDQGKAENYSQNAIFKTEQGKYLASSLGDPLIKGLTEIADKRPTDPVAYLAGFLQNFIKSRKNNRDNDTGDTNSTALANSEAEFIATPNNANELDSPAKVEERFSSPESTPKKEDRDEHGQSMLHFACARSHRRNGLLNLIEESQIDVTYRDELYRTARDVSLQANQPANAKEIDRYVLSLAVVGDTKPFENMAIAGYDHILDVVDDEGTSIADIAESRGHDKLVEFFNELRNLEETREELHQATRDGDFERVKEITSSRRGKWLIKAKNYYGRNAMHIAVLKEHEEMVEYFVNTCSDALKIGDNLERTPLHYAMGTNSVEGVSRVLIRKGAKRTIKDLKGRQPSYYFINKADILRLQEEEDEHR